MTLQVGDFVKFDFSCYGATECGLGRIQSIKPAKLLMFIKPSVKFCYDSDNVTVSFDDDTSVNNLPLVKVEISEKEKLKLILSI